MAGNNFLFVPGPTNVPQRVMRAMVVAMEDHRSVNFPELTRTCLAGLKKVFKTKSGTPFIFPATGTGGWESAIANTLSPGDKVLASRFGQFSHLWIDMCQRFGLEVEVVDCEWGTGVPVEKYQQILEADKGHKIKAVLATHNETATGVTSDIAATRKAMDAAKHPALLMVDSVSGLASIPFEMDAWKVDVCVSGSQKGMMMPAGLALVCVSEKALALRTQAKLPRCFFDYSDMIKSNDTGYFPYTPALPMLYGLKESLKIIEEEGLDNMIARHSFLAGGTRAAIQKGWKLDVCAKEPKWYSDTVSAVVVPEGADGAKVIDRAYRRYNLALGAGLSKVAGKVFRIGHIGDMNELGMLAAISGAEMSMLDVGIKVEPGSGVAEASKFFRDKANQPKEYHGGGVNPVVF